MNGQVSGTVKWYNTDKGYGFVAVEGGQDVFVHVSAITDGRRELAEGQHVSLDVKQGQKGYEASDVRVTQDVESFQVRPARPNYGGGGGRFGAHNRGDSSEGGSRRPRTEREPYTGAIPSGAVKARVLRVDPAERFMFVYAEDPGIDVYVHQSLFSYGPQPREGDIVWITIEPSDRGLRARTLELA